MRCDFVFWGAAALGGLVPVHGQDNTMRRPNILFCIADDAAWLHFGAYGCQWVSTPVFDSVAARGVLFENCYTPNAKSAPSRASLLTGRYSWQLGEAGNHICHFPEDAGVFTEALEEAGYDVAFTGKGWAPGNPGMKNGRRRQLTGEAWQNRKLTPPTSEMLATDYAANFSDFLSSREDASRPWFFWFGCREPHRRYEYG
ncbi:sulfatase-like hydrolase/transferase, partial [Alistipes shahii]